jgi:hypothetical protein
VVMLKRVHHIPPVYQKQKLESWGQREEHRLLKEKERHKRKLEMLKRVVKERKDKSP